MAYWDQLRETPSGGSVLLVMRAGDCRVVGSIFAPWGVEVVWAHSRHAAESILLSNPAFALVITEERLPDGDWRMVADAVRQCGSHAVVLVKHAEPEPAEEHIRHALEEDWGPRGLLVVSAA